jgi:hypothetical protein
MGYHLVVRLHWRNRDVELSLTIDDRPHFGRGRWVPPDPLFHTSVKIRMSDARLGYKPRARYQKGSETYVS